MTRTRSRWAGIDLLSAAAALCLLLIRPTLAAPASSVPEEPEQPAAAETAEGSGGLSTGTAAAGTAILVGTGAYTAVRKKWNEEKENAKPKEYVRYENHTREGTLTPEERRDLID